MEFEAKEVRKVASEKLALWMEMKEQKSMAEVNDKIWDAANQGKMHALVGFPEQVVLDYLAAKGFIIRFAVGVGYDVWWA